MTLRANFFRFWFLLLCKFFVYRLKLFIRPWCSILMRNFFRWHLFYILRNLIFHRFIFVKFWRSFFSLLFYSANNIVFETLKFFLNFTFFFMCFLELFFKLFDLFIEFIHFLSYFTWLMLTLCYSFWKSLLTLLCFLTNKG